MTRSTKYLKIAEEQDREDVIRLCKQMYDISHWDHVDFSEEKCNDLFSTYLASDKTRLIVLLMCDPDPIGVLIGSAVELPFSTTKIGTELVWWMDKDRQDIRSLIQLFDAFEFWCLKIGCKTIQSGSLKCLADLSKFYARRGYFQAEQTFIRKL